MRNGGQKVFDMTKNGEGGFNDPAMIKAGEQLAELGKLEPFQPGYLGATWPQTLGVFGDGRGGDDPRASRTPKPTSAPIPATRKA